MGAGEGTAPDAVAEVLRLLGRQGREGQEGRQGRVAVGGPWGAGKSTLFDAALDALVRKDPARRVLRLVLRPADRELPYGVLAALLDRYGPPDAVRDPDPAELRARTRRLLTARPGTVLALDGVQWLDAGTAAVLGGLLDGPTAVLVTERGEPTAAGLPCATALLGPYVPVVGAAAFDMARTAAALAGAGLTTRWAPAVHHHCGGHPLLTRRLCAALAAGPPRGGRLVLPEAAREQAAIWLDTLPGPVRATLTAAALAPRPTAALLARAGYEDAEDHLRTARRAGVLSDGEPRGVRFAADALRQAAAGAGRGSERRRAHRRLAEATRDPVHRVHHRALARDTPDTELAGEAERAATAARAAGERELAAHLLLLAARLTPVPLREDCLRRLSAAAADAAAAASLDLAQDVCDALAEAGGSRGRQLAALLALVDAHGQALEEADALLARARELAGGDAALLARVELRRAVRINVCQGAPDQARSAAGRAAELARTAGDTATRAAALTMRARMERITGSHRTARRTLTQALALSVPAAAIGIRNSPQYLAARHAVFDDRLDDARVRLLALLPQAEYTGDTEDVVDILRSLAEADSRLGRCARALEWAARAQDLTVRTGLSPGPAWYTASLAQRAGGSFAGAAEAAGLGVRASREDHDVIHLSRNLWVLGSVHLATGDLGAARAALEEVAAIEGTQRVADPTMLRWQPDAVEVYAASPATLDRAEELLARTRTAQAATGAAAPSSAAALHRAEAACLAQRGDAAAAVARLTVAAALFTAAGLPLETGRCHLARGRLERSRRRQAAARTAWEEAQEVFAACGAGPWHGLASDLLGRLGGGTARHPGPEELTDSERRLAELVRAGASNQEAAARLFISVKTVEAVLSRVYRKLGIRSRAGLSGALGPP